MSELFNFEKSQKLDKLKEYYFNGFPIENIEYIYHINLNCSYAQKQTCTF